MWRDAFVLFMQAQMWLWKRKNLKTKKEEICQVQGALRPIELWEYVFPEECFDEVCTMLNIKGADSIGKTKEAVIRKALGHGVKPVPEYKEVPTNKYVEKRGVGIVPIGIKKDPRAEKEIWGYEQEML